MVFQSAHAWLAAKVLEPWRVLTPDLDWEPLLLATALHDHGWNPTDLNGTLHGREPLNFLDVTLGEAARVGQRSVDWAFAQDSKVGILVAHHFHYLYGAKESPELKVLGNEWARRRDTTLSQLGLSEDWLSTHYEMLFWADALSLLLVCRPGPFTQLLSLKTAGYDFDFVQHSDQSYTLSPWPFGVEELVCEYDFRTIEKLDFEQAQVLKKMLQNAAIQSRRVVVRS